MRTVRIGPKHQITIPKDAYDSLRLEVGDFLETEVRENALVFVPKKLVPKDQAWFWTKEWQQMEKEADEAIRKGEVTGPFDDVEEALEALKK
jgi:antitoxin MazE